MTAREAIEAAQRAGRAGLTVAEAKARLARAVVAEHETADIVCPYCGAPAGFPCNAEREGEFLVHIHQARGSA